jgi:hypothetical protein
LRLSSAAAAAAAAAAVVSSLCQLQQWRLLMLLFTQLL